MSTLRFATRTPPLEIRDVGRAELSLDEWIELRFGTGPELAVLLQHLQTDRLDNDLAGLEPGRQTFAIARHGLRSY
jgi:hypothetical protein